MNIEKNVNLANLTSLKVGGVAENYVLVGSTTELIETLKSVENKKVTLLGFGCNSLISDNGIDGLVVNVRGGNIKYDGDVVVADAGVWWDDLVVSSIDNNLWGLELMSEIPGSVGAATFINITAYGQSIGERVLWVEVWNRKNKEIIRLAKNELVWDYKKSFFQENENYIILRVALQLSKNPTHHLIYQKALDVAEELGLDANYLVDRREIIIEARKRAGSIWHQNDETADRTAGSFFRNPIVSSKLAEKIISFDESGKTAEQIKNMNRVHGGDEKRVSAAHVMLASGLKRGQKWNKVKLNDKNVLKIETLPGATAQEVYDVMSEIQQICLEKTGIKLEPEVQIIGNFKWPDSHNLNKAD